MLSNPVSQGAGEATGDTSVPHKGWRGVRGVWGGGRWCWVSPGDTAGLVVFLWLRSYVLCVLCFSVCITSHSQTSSTPEAGDGGKVGLGAIGGGCTGVSPVSPVPLLSPTRGHWCCQDSLTEPVKLEIIVSEKVSHLFGSSAAVGSALREKARKRAYRQRQDACSKGGGIVPELCAGTDKDQNLF